MERAAPLVEPADPARRAGAPREAPQDRSRAAREDAAGRRAGAEASDGAPWAPVGLSGVLAGVPGCRRYRRCRKGTTDGAGGVITTGAGGAGAGEGSGSATGAGAAV